MACIQEEGGNDCGGSRQEGMKEEDERSCRVRGKMKEEEEEREEQRVGGWRRTTSHSDLAGQRDALHPVFQKSNFKIRVFNNFRCRWSRSGAA